MSIRLGFTLKNIIVDLLALYSLSICLRAVLSWFTDTYSKLMRVLVRFTEPAIAPVRNVLNRWLGMLPIDFSPAVTVILIEILRNVISRIFR